MGLVKRVVNFPYRLYKQREYNKTTASNPQHNDVYIVEFPKSGITWLSTLLANVALVSSGRKEIANFTAAHLYIPDIHLTRNISEPIYHTPPVRLIKSHAKFNPNYLFVILLVRHPLNVMKSYYRYLRELGVNVGDFNNFIQSEKYGIPEWKRHVNSWLTGGVIAQRLHL